MKGRHLPWPVDDAGCGLRSVSCISNSHLFGLIVCIKEILESCVTSRLCDTHAFATCLHVSMRGYFHSFSTLTKEARLSLEMIQVTHDHDVDRSTTIFHLDNSYDNIFVRDNSFFFNKKV